MSEVRGSGLRVPGSSKRNSCSYRFNWWECNPPMRKVERVSANQARSLFTINNHLARNKSDIFFRKPTSKREFVRNLAFKCIPSNSVTI